MDIKYKTINPLLYKYHDIKKRATKKKMKISTFKLLKRFLKKPCYYCKETKNIGLDRIKNHLGYTTTNVIPCCHRCNFTRNINWTVEEAKAMISLGLKMRAEKTST